MSDIPLLTFRATTDASAVAVDLDTLIVSRVLIQANSGGGKSRALRYLLEQTYGHIQQIVLDPEGDFSSLRQRFPYLLAGRDGDVPAEPASAAVSRSVDQLAAQPVATANDRVG